MAQLTDVKRAMHREYMRAWRAANPHERRQVALRYRTKNAARVAERKRAGRELYESLKAKPCLDCGGTFPPECMDFDHVRGEKIQGIGSMGQWPAAKMLAEIEKCDLVCSNCHRIRTRARKLAA